MSHSITGLLFADSPGQSVAALGDGLEEREGSCSQPLKLPLGDLHCSFLGEKIYKSFSMNEALTWQRELDCHLGQMRTSQ